MLSCPFIYRSRHGPEGRLLFHKAAPLIVKIGIIGLTKLWINTVRDQRRVKECATPREESAYWNFQGLQTLFLKWPWLLDFIDLLTKNRTLN